MSLVPPLVPPSLTNVRRPSSGTSSIREAVGGAIALVAAVVGVVSAKFTWASSYFELRVEISLDVVGAGRRTAR